MMRNSSTYESQGLRVQSIVATTVTVRDIEKMNSDSPRQRDTSWPEDLWAQIDNQELE